MTNAYNSGSYSIDSSMRDAFSTIIANNTKVSADDPHSPFREAERVRELRTELSLLRRENIKLRRLLECERMFIHFPKIKTVIFNNPATIVFWEDGTKTVVKKGKYDKKFDPEKGLAMAIAKKVLGNQGNYYKTFKQYLED